MAHVVLLGHTKREFELKEALAKGFHVLTQFPTINEGITAMHWAQPEVVLLAENMTPSARGMVAEKLQALAPTARLIFLYEHFVDSAQFADAIVDMKADPEYLLAAIDYVSLRQGSIWKSAVAA